jgi:putative zinc finger protein
MPGEIKGGMQCGEFEALLSEGIEGTLNAAQMESFRAHSSTCPNCGPLFAEAAAGRRWLKSLEEVEPPHHLLHNILLATSGVESQLEQKPAKPQPSWTDKVFGWAAPIVATVRQPRFAMSFGMAFFSISIMLNVAGFRLRDLRRVDLRPGALSRFYYETEARVVKYYENIRFVYEFESRVREFKRATTPEETTPPPKQNEKEQHKDHKDTTGTPHEGNDLYSREDMQPVLACVTGWQCNPASATRRHV